MRAARWYHELLLVLANHVVVGDDEEFLVGKELIMVLTAENLRGFYTGSQRSSTSTGEGILTQALQKMVSRTFEHHYPPNPATRIRRAKRFYHQQLKKHEV